MESGNRLETELDTVPVLRVQVLLGQGLWVWLPGEVEWEAWSGGNGDGCKWVEADVRERGCEG